MGNQHTEGAAARVVSALANGPRNTQAVAEVCNLTANQARELLEAAVVLGQVKRVPTRPGQRAVWRLTGEGGGEATQDDPTKEVLRSLPWMRQTLDALQGRVDDLRQNSADLDDAWATRMEAVRDALAREVDGRVRGDGELGEKIRQLAVHVDRVEGTALAARSRACDLDFAVGAAAKCAEAAQREAHAALATAQATQASVAGVATASRDAWTEVQAALDEARGAARRPGPASPAVVALVAVAGLPGLILTLAWMLGVL